MKASTAGLISVGSVATAAIIGGSWGPQQPRAGVWYATLRKPAYTPSGPVIAVTWGALESLLCVVGARLLTRRASPARAAALLAWSAALAGLAGYPAVFFGRRRLGESALVSAAMLGATAATTIAAERVDKPAAAAMAPLVVWTAFATLLSEELWRLRRV